jgi:uncharacterized protein YraI
MKTQFGFTQMSLSEFEGWLKRQQLARTVLYLQQHHTWSPAYAQFTGGNHFALQQAMKHHHVSSNGWADIGQHFTTFPDGSIMTGRPLEQSPACIYGNNSGAICVEHLGNFDTGKDAMTPAQRKTIIQMSALICARYGIPVTTDRVVYHHWFDLRTGARTNGSGSTKTCPGTAFFGGNSVEKAKSSFLPLVRAAMPAAGTTATTPKPDVSFYGSVTSSTLNVRTGPAASFAKVNTVLLGSIVRVYDQRDGWLKISASRKEWVSGKFVTEVLRATVTAPALNVRSGPGVSFARVASLAKGQEVFSYEATNGWCRISPEQRWVAASLLQMD